MIDLLVIQPGEKISNLLPEPGDFSDWIFSSIDKEELSYKVVYPHRNEELPNPDSVRAAIITGSTAMVDDSVYWVSPLLDWVREASDCNVAMLGVCFGHQVIAAALGGIVSDNPNGLEVGIVPSHISSSGVDDPLFCNLPSPILVSTSHMQSVITLPRGAECLARSDKDPHHAFRIKDKPIWGVQFHPEFSTRVAREYVRFFRRELMDDGQEPDKLMSGECDAQLVGTIMQRFAKYACPVDVAGLN